MPQPHLVDSADLARELSELAAVPELALRSDELRSLARDLAGGKDLAQWAEVDLLGSFARPESLAAPPTTGAPPGLLRRPWQQPRKLLRWTWDVVRQRAIREDLLESVLGVLVFVPLLITWFGLWDASQAYAELREEEPRQATRPFLQLWQTGFGGRVSALGRFDTVALMAVLVIVVIVLTAIWHAWARNRAERQRERLLGQLVAVLSRTQLALSAHRAASPRRFTGELSKAASRLESLISTAADGQNALAKAAAAARSATTALENASQGLTGAAGPLGSATGRLEAAVRAAQAETARLSNANADQMRQVGDRIGQLGQQAECAVKDLTGVQRELLDATRAVIAATDQAAQAMVASSSRTDGAVHRMRDAAERWDVAAAHWQDAAARVDAGVRTLTGAAPRWADPAPAQPDGTGSGRGTET